MNTDDFEKRLQRQPLRQAPAEWRAEILSAARQAAAPQHAPRNTRHDRPSLLAILRAQLAALLWPRPVAWGALAAAWLVILGLNLSAPGTSPQVVRSSTPPSSQGFLAFQEQARLLVELIGPWEASVVERPKAVLPRPRSERRLRLALA
jgi:hypothetical protein